MVIRMFIGIILAIFWSWVLPPLAAWAGFPIVAYWPFISAGATGGAVLAGSIVTFLHLIGTPVGRPLELPSNRVRGVARDVKDVRGQTMHLYFRRRVSEDDIRRTHDLLR